MKHLQQFLLVAVVVMLAVPAAAFGAQTPMRLTESEAKALIKRIDNAAERFRKTVNTALDSSVLNKTQTENHINRYIKDLEHYTDSLKDHYSDAHTATATVEQILARGSNIEGFLQQHQLLNESVTTDWGVLRVGLDELAAAYGVKWGSTGVAGVVYRVTQEEVKDLLSRIDHNAEEFRDGIDDRLDKSSLDKTSIEHNYNLFLKDFAAATDRLKASFGDRNLAAEIALEILQKAKVINEHLKKFPQATKTQSNWALVRDDLDILAKYYGVNWQW